MPSYMEELSAAFIGWLRHRDAVQDAVIRLIQKTDTRFEDDEDLRKSELQRLRNDFWRVAVAERLTDKGSTSTSSAQLLKRAEELLAKKCYDPLVHRRPPNMRTKEEEDHYLAARVRWSGLLKKAKVRAADSRGGDTSHFRRR
jgi:hypothetical protein